MENNKVDIIQTTEEIVSEEKSLPPMGFEVIKREFMKDKLALFALIILVGIFVVAVCAPFFMDLDKLTRVDIFNRYTAPGQGGYILGSDEGGRDILALLVVGTRNSVFIGVCITIFSIIIGVALGIISGYYGGVIDDILMRIVDFIMVLPVIMIIIVVVTIVHKFTIWTLIWVLTAFSWSGITRLFRTATLSEASKDYIAASKTMGTPDWKIMFFGLLPNLSSLFITNFILNFAGNIGVETGLSFLGFGLPVGTPSLGTLIGYASSPDIIENKKWVWLPAALLVLVMMLCINYIGQALGRAADSKRRLG
ncbi:ABC transporter permease [Vaginisenegalia massiliensis]|uniref:ABC transporter permease n=1 Tax=Vaginisenegalia massiliensis TaxID=2058294 RepID=UPI000F53303A|nr:ABC transporter permease [Vaginisenegalia massiliensis]